MFETNPKLAKKPKSRKQKNRRVGVEHRGVCVECSKQTQNSEAKNRGVHISLQIIRSRRSKKSFQYLFFLFLKKVFF